MQSAGAAPSNSPSLETPEFADADPLFRVWNLELQSEETTQWLEGFNPPDQALRPDFRKEGEESPPTLTPAPQADLRGSVKVGTSDDSRVHQVGREGFENPNSGHAIVQYQPELGGDQESVRLQRKKRKYWKGNEKESFRLLRSEAESKPGCRRGKPLWDFISGELLARHNIRATPEECKNLGDTCKKIFDVSQWKGPRNSGSNKHSLQKPNDTMDDTMDDTMNLIHQKKLSIESGGIVGHESLGEGDGDGDEDMLVTEKSQPAIDYSGIIKSEIHALVQSLVPLCMEKEYIELLKSIIPQVELEVGTKVELAIKDSEPRFLLHKGYRGKAFWEYRVRTMIRKEVDTAFERVGITSTLLNAAHQEYELHLCREQNRILQKEIQTFQERQYTMTSHTMTSRSVEHLQ